MVSSWPRVKQTRPEMRRRSVARRDFIVECCMTVQCETGLDCSLWGIEASDRVTLNTNPQRYLIRLHWPHMCDVPAEKLKEALIRTAQCQYCGSLCKSVADKSHIWQGLTYKQKIYARMYVCNRIDYERNTNQMHGICLWVQTSWIVILWLT